MKYPILNATKSAELATLLAGGGRPVIDPHAVWVGTGEEVDLIPVETIASEIIDAARTWTDRDRDRFEGAQSTRFFEALSMIPIEVLDDRGFWRYLSLRYFWEFIAWREEEAFARGNHQKYVDATSSAEAVLPRMYLRARAVGGIAYADLAAAIPKGGDFWRSHVIRVRTGSASALTRSLVRRQRDHRLMTDSLREAAKRLNRTWTNVVLYLHDDNAASAVVDVIWEERG